MTVRHVLVVAITGSRNHDVKDFATQLTRPRTVPFSLKVQAVGYVVLAAFAPLVLLLAVSSKFFEHGPKSPVPFEYWAFLTVTWVLASAMLIAHILAKGLTEQIEPIANSIDVLTRNTLVPASSVPSTGNELERLAAQFSSLEAALADSRSAALGRIAELEAINGSLGAAIELNANFLSAVSHEIRTPLSAIVSAARIIQQHHQARPEVASRFGETIAIEGKRLVRLITDLLDLSKMETGVTDWSRDVVRPADAVGVAVRRVESLLTEHSLKLRCDVSEGLPHLLCDEKRLVQLVENLLENAAKCTPKGSTIDLIAVEHDGFIRFTVRDHGNAIPAASQEQIFDKSHAISLRHSKEWSRHGATLLGLPLCREIVKGQGGRIWAANAADGGVSFCFELPIPAADSVEERAVGAAAVLRVLLVMPNDLLAEAAERALRLDDIDCRLATHFQQVLSSVKDWVPDVLVVASSCLWQLTEGIEARLRRAGVGHILMFSPFEGMVDLNPPTNCGPLLACLGDLAPRGSEVLLVEDDEEYAAVVEFELIQHGFRVARAGNGVEAIERIEKHCPAAMILDLVLPRVDGFAVIDRLRAKQVFVPTLVLTALEDETVGKRLDGLGVMGVYRKYELIQPRRLDDAARVRKILTPVIVSTNDLQHAPPSRRVSHG